MSGDIGASVPRRKGETQGIAPVSSMAVAEKVVGEERTRLEAVRKRIINLLGFTSKRKSKNLPRRKRKRRKRRGRKQEPLIPL